MRKVLYIMSPGHSGSTLLTLLLGTHPEISTIGERRYLVQRITDHSVESNYCVCGKWIPECEYLTDLYDLGRRNLPSYLRDVDFTHFHYSLNQRVNGFLRRMQRRIRYGDRAGIAGTILSTPSRQLMRANLAIIDRVLEMEGGTMFLDGSKSTVDLAHMVASHEIEITLIHLSRDGRGQYHSFMRNRPEYSEEEAARRFRKWHNRITRVVDRFEAKLIRVRYEDVCEDPLSELARIGKELQLDPSGFSLDFRSGVGHAIGNGRLMTSDTTRIVNKETWRSELTGQQLAVFERIAGDANRAFGYTD